MNNKVIDFLNKKGFYNINNSYYSKYLNEWEYWYRARKGKFHEYYDAFDIQRKMYTMGMAKKTCEDWASIIWSERDTINTSNKKNNKYVNSLVQDYSLYTSMFSAIEKSSWSGTCGAVVRLTDAIVENGILQADVNTKNELILMDARHIIPLRKEHGKIVDVAFVSETDVKVNNEIVGQVLFSSLMREN